MRIPELPFNGIGQMPRHNSYLGAVAASQTVDVKVERLRRLYETSGPQTDHEAAAALVLPVSSICSLRAMLRKRGVVASCGRKLGPWGVTNTRWGLV